MPEIERGNVAKELQEKTNVFERLVGNYFVTSENKKIAGDSMAVSFVKNGDSVSVILPKAIYSGTTKLDISLVKFAVEKAGAVIIYKANLETWASHQWFEEEMSVDLRGDLREAPMLSKIISGTIGVGHARKGFLVRKD